MSRMITQSLKTVHGVDLRTPPLPDPPKRVTLGKQPHVLTVACVWWNHTGAYPVEYVEKLRDGVRRNLSVPHDFVCITPHKNVPEGVIRMEPPTLAKGWWQKVGLFSPDLFGPSRRILYLDLDVVIVNSLDEIASCTDDFCMIENFGPNKGHAAHNSSCMLWTPTPETHRIFTEFSDDVVRELHGDQCWIWRVMGDDVIRDFERHMCVSYKYCKQKREWNWATPDTSVVVFHGQPKPHQVRSEFPEW